MLIPGRVLIPMGIILGKPYDTKIGPGFPQVENIRKCKTQNSFQINPYESLILSNYDY